MEEGSSSGGSQHEDAAPDGRSDLRLLRRLLEYLRPYKWPALAALALILLSALLVLPGPLLTQAAVNLYLAPDPSRQPDGFELWLKRCAEAAGWGGAGHHGVAFIALALLLTNLAAFMTRYAQWMMMETLAQNVMRDLRKAIFVHLQQVSIPFYDRTAVGRLTTRLTNDVDSLNEVFTSGVIGALVDAAMALYIVIWMALVSWRLALLSLVILPPLALVANWFRRGARPALRDVRAQVARLNAFLQEHLSGIHIIQLYGREAGEMEAFDHINRAHRRASLDALFYHLVFYPGIEVLGASGVALIIWYGGIQVMREAISLGAFIAFIQLAQAFYTPVSNISEKYNIFQAALASCERIFRLLDEPVSLNPPGGPAPCKGRGRIEFRNVWFAYKADEWVLKDVSFVVEPGERVAFVGHTGAGKTTITNLLLRFYEIQRGQILFNGTDIREVDLHELRSSFSVVPQEVFLFSGDIASNIRLRDQTITDNQIRSAAREVCASEFIEKSKGGYRSPISARGAELSAGQKQLIGFARALAFNRGVLILDEATSAIDPTTEMLIRKAVERLTAGRTSLIIAHRLSTVQSADRILVMQKGEIREVGDHHSLLARHGLYWKFYQLQRLHDGLREAAGEGLTAD